MEIGMEVHQKIELPYDPATQLLCIHLKVYICKSAYNKRCLHTHIYHSTKLRNQPRCPSRDEWIKKLIYMLWSIIQSKRMMSFAGKWVEMEFILSEINQTQTEKHYVFTHIWNQDLKKKGKKEVCVGKYDQGTLYACVKRS
jgi:hypothetical protein